MHESDDDRLMYERLCLTKYHERSQFFMFALLCRSSTVAVSIFINPPGSIVLIGTDPKASIWMKDRSCGEICCSLDISMLWKMNNTVVVKSDKFKSKLALICPLTRSEVEVGPLPIGRPSPNHDKRLVSSHWFDQPAGTSDLVIEVVTLFDVRDQCRALRPPSQQFLCLLARRRIVVRHKIGKKAEVVACVLSGDADNRQLQLATDGLSDLPERYALLAGSVQS